VPESTRPVSAATLLLAALAGIGSHVVTPDGEKPAFGAPLHCIGVRSPSRPFSFGQPVMPTGSRTSSLRFGGVVTMPISSP